MTLMPRAKNRYRLGLLGLLLIVLAAGAYYAAHGPESPAASTPVPEAERSSAPDFAGIDAWINSAPLTLKQLRGKVVLVDFWTFSCINCVRTIPHLKDLESQFGKQGLVIVGVHSPEFDFEKDVGNVRAATARLGITWPVAVDSEMATWNAFGNQYWPAEYLIDQQGRLASSHFGEGDYAATSSAIASLLKVPDATARPNQSSPSAGTTPELYAGSNRGNLADGEAYGSAGTATNYPYHQPTAPDRPLLAGEWTDRGDYLVAGQNAHVLLNFHAGELFMVVGPGSAGASQLNVTLDGGAVAPGNRGADLNNDRVSVTRQDLFHVLTEIGSGIHTIDVALPPGAQLYTFTFG